MILKGSQRGGAAQLAAHLLNTHENEHVEIHEISRFMSDDLHGALKEIYAVSRGTKCKQFMFSVSLSPPEMEDTPVEYFEKALGAIEKKTGLEGQPRVIVFHEKEGRRHCHAVWSRIDVAEMKAINLPHFKLKLRDISKQLYFEYGWKMPDGLRDARERDPASYSLAQWQQARRVGENPKLIRAAFQECWAVSDSRAAFAQALKENGYVLARGDRRGFVAVDYRGEVYSLSRWLGIRPRQLKERLGAAEDLPSVKNAKAWIARRMGKTLRRYVRETRARAEDGKGLLLRKKQALARQHREERQALDEKQEKRRREENAHRASRLPRGFGGLWHRLTGKYQRIRRDNEKETQICLWRDRYEKQVLINRQLQERQNLQTHIRAFRKDYDLKIQELRRDIARYMEMGGAPPDVRGNQEHGRKRDTTIARPDIDRGYEPEM